MITVSFQTQCLNKHEKQSKTLQLNYENPHFNKKFCINKLNSCILNCSKCMHISKDGSMNTMPKPSTFRRKASNKIQKRKKH